MIRTAEELKNRIIELEVVRELEKNALKKQLHEVRESLKPVNLIKNSVKQAVASPGVKGKVITALLGLAAGYLAKRAIFGASVGPLKKLAGNLVQMGVAGTVSNKGDNLRTLGGDLLKRIFRGRSSKRKKDILDNVDQI